MKADGMDSGLQMQTAKEMLLFGTISLDEYLKLTDTRLALEIPMYVDTFYRVRKAPCPQALSLPQRRL